MNKKKLLLILSSILWIIIIISLLYNFLANKNTEPTKENNINNNWTTNSSWTTEPLRAGNWEILEFHEEEKFKYDYDAAVKVLREDIKADMDKYKTMQSTSIYRYILLMEEVNRKKYSDIDKIYNLYKKKQEENKLTYKITKKSVENIKNEKWEVVDELYNIEITIDWIYNNMYWEIDYIIKDKKTNNTINMKDIIWNNDNFIVYEDRSIWKNVIYLQYTKNNGIEPLNILVQYVWNDFNKKTSELDISLI